MTDNIQMPWWKTCGPQELVGGVATFKGQSEPAGVITAWSTVPNEGLQLVVGGTTRYAAADLISVELR